MTHTPGPWQPFRKNGVNAVMDKDRNEVIHWMGFDRCEIPEHVHAANARLIAAAPDLLAALQMLVEEACEDDRDPSLMKAFELSYAAIAKAKA